MTDNTAHTPKYSGKEIARMMASLSLWHPKITGVPPHEFQPLFSCPYLVEDPEEYGDHTESKGECLGDMFIVGVVVVEPTPGGDRQSLKVVLRCQCSHGHEWNTVIGPEDDRLPMFCDVFVIPVTPHGIVGTPGWIPGVNVDLTATML